MPLPAMESPITFKVKDDASYWFDHENEGRREGHAQPVAGRRGRAHHHQDATSTSPDVEEAHTVTFIVWPEGAKNMPFDHRWQ